MDKETIAVIAPRLGALMTSQHPRYFAYMLRLWRVRANGEETWRVSLQSAHTGERRGFADLESLFAFLKQESSEQRRDGEGTKNRNQT